MKSIRQRLSCLALFCLCSASAPAAVITLIDSSTLNGSFENGTGNNSVLSWTAAPGHFLERMNNNASQGAWSLVIGRNASGSPISGAAINTGFNIVTGATFDLSFSLRGAFEADATDAVNWALYYTSDDTLGGMPTVLASGSNLLAGATGVLATSPYTSTGVMTSAAADVASSGKILFLSITPGAGFSNNEFARIDNVVLTANVPEAGTAGMGGLALALILSRRRR